VLLAVTCPVCGRPGGAPCGPCAAALRPPPRLPPPPGVNACHSLLAYEGAGRELIARLKHRGNRAALPGLAVAAAALVAHEPLDLVTWAPTTGRRRRARGFDQAELLARRVARHRRLPCRRLLARAEGPAQTGRSAAERWRGPAFRARRAAGGTVLLVDDVVTTGATAAAAARALRSAGARRVVLLTLGRTSLKAAR
jgi:predicted amidophosphoribosyltransferase